MGGCTASTSPSNSAKAESRHTAGVSAPTSYRPSRTAACATCYSRTGPLHQPVSCRCVAVTIGNATGSQDAFAPQRPSDREIVKHEPFPGPGLDAVSPP